MTPRTDWHSSCRAAISSIAARHSGTSHCSRSFAFTFAQAAAIANRVRSQLLAPAGAVGGSGVALRDLRRLEALLLRDVAGVPINSATMIATRSGRLAHRTAEGARIAERARVHRAPTRLRASSSSSPSSRSTRQIHQLQEA